MAILFLYLGKISNFMVEGNNCVYNKLYKRKRSFPFEAVKTKNIKMENNQHLVDSILETVREELADFIEVES